MEGHLMTQAPVAHLLPSNGKTVLLPEEVFLCSCDFRRRGGDLVLTSPHGTEVVLRHYYTINRPPYLRDQSGDLLSGELSRLLAGLSKQAVSALMKCSLHSHPHAS